jgi:glycosyltransferase involved in cell wall biosynthesis
MRIAQVAPLHESVPPKLYGGTERIVSYLTEALVADGHEVTLFASGDSVTAAELVPCCPQALRLDSRVRDPIPHHVVQLEALRQRADRFDVIHFHTDYLHFPLIRTFADRTVTTLHGRIDLPDLMPLYRAFPDIPLVSISQHQRRPLPHANWAGTVHHGLPDTLLPFTGSPGQYLAFLGRISPEKRPDRAIEIAVRTGLPLKIAAKIGEADRAYWDEVIRPMVEAHPNVEFVGEINEAQKARFLGNAAALLFPIDWPEPFGLVMIESMACGTPVIAFGCGSVPEIVDHGRSGFIVTNIDEAVEAVASLPLLDRREVRAAFDARFSATRMAADYLSVYYSLAGVRLEAAHLRRVQHAEATLQVVA